MRTHYNPEDPTYAYRRVQYAKGRKLWAKAACWELISTIEAAGGLVRLPDGSTEPVGDREWLDLADAYLLACLSADREPLIEDIHEELEPDGDCM